jgi:hypothetical protein
MLKPSATNSYHLIMPTSRYHNITPSNAPELERAKPLAVSTVRALDSLPVRALDVMDFDAELGPGGVSGWVDITADEVAVIIRVTFRYDTEHGALDALHVDGVALLTGAITKRLETETPVCALCERLLQAERDDRAVGSLF